MTEEEFLRHRNALGTLKAQKIQSLYDRTNFLWDEINSQRYNFDRQNLELTELNSITLDHIKQFFSVSCDASLIH